MLRIILVRQFLVFWSCRNNDILQQLGSPLIIIKESSPFTPIETCFFFVCFFNFKNFSLGPISMHTKPFDYRGQTNKHLWIQILFIVLSSSSNTLKNFEW